MQNGKSIVIGERTLAVRPFNLKTLRVVLPKLETLGHLGNRMPTVQEIDFIIDIFVGALSNNTPEVTREFLEENVDVTMLDSMFSTVLAASGIGRVKEGEAASP